MALSKLSILTSVLLASVASFGTISTSTLPITPGWQGGNQRERGVWISALRQSQFATVAHTSARPSCEVSEPPEALATPDPLLEIPDSKTKITVSFIVGTDGKIHSPLILESAGASEDRTVLNAVRSWIYRPAKCNGVPTEAEGKIQFLSR
jgi:hypothetical protein